MAFFLGFMVGGFVFSVILILLFSVALQRLSDQRQEAEDRRQKEDPTSATCPQTSASKEGPKAEE